MVLAAAPMGSDGGIGPDRAHPTYPKGCRDESCLSGGRGHDTEVRYRRKGHAGKRRLFVCSTRVVMKNDFCTTSEVTKPFKVQAPQTGRNQLEGVLGHVRGRL